MFLEGRFINVSSLWRLVTSAAGKMEVTADELAYTFPWDCQGLLTTETNSTGEVKIFFHIPE